ncbi:MAG: sensor domain-containing diguanylate cyclase [Nitrospirota bacterium]
MHKIALIGKSAQKTEYEEALIALGHHVSKYDSIEKVLPFLVEKADVIIIDKTMNSSPSFRDFLKASKNIPKIIISDSYSFRGFTPWIREPLSYPLYVPSPSVLLNYIKKSLKESSLFHENNRIKTDLLLAKRELNFYQEVSKALTSSLDLNDVLTRIMRKIKAMTKAEAWSVLLVDQETGELVFEKTDVPKTKGMQKFRMKMGEGIAGWVAKEGIPVVVPDVSKDERFLGKIDRAIHFKTKSLICVPIKTNEQVLGVIELVNKTTGGHFVKEDLDLLMRLVDQTAIVIEKTSLYQKMTELAITDDLTKLFNTRYLNRTIEIEIQRSSRYGTSLSLIFMDVDHFKRINDSYGHLIGSKVLVEVGQLLLKSLRTVDIVARYGGDEFVIVLPQTPPEAATQIAERMRKAIEQNSFLKKEGYALKMTASFGVASYPESAKSKEELVKIADDAMYRVKHHTRNAVYAIV